MLVVMLMIMGKKRFEKEGKERRREEN